MNNRIDTLSEKREFICRKIIIGINPAKDKQRLEKLIYPNTTGDNPTLSGLSTEVPAFAGRRYGQSAARRASRRSVSWRLLIC